MLRRIRKKGGFTLVEVLVAFVIFAIMAAMVSVIVQSTMRAKQENIRNDALIEEQKAAYYQKEQPASADDYKAKSVAGNSYKGNLSLTFGSDTITIPYVSADPTSTSDSFELEYYIGENGNDVWKTTQTSNNKNGKNGDLLSALNCGIYGSAGVESVTIGIAERDASKNQYYVFLKVKSQNGRDENLKPFYQMRIKFPVDIASIGYIEKNGNDDGDTNNKDAKAQLAVMGDSSTLRVSGDGKGKSIFNLDDQYVLCYVTLASPLSSDQLSDMTKMFGTSGKGKSDSFDDTVTIKSRYGDRDITVYKTTFEQFVSSKDETYINVFAATEKEDTKTP